MASFKLLFARIKGTPGSATLATKMEAYGLPDSEEYGVLSCQASETVCFGTIVRRTSQAIPTLDTETRELSARPVERVQVIPFAVKPAIERLEVYAGSASAIESVGIFLAGCLALPTLVEGIELDVPAALEKLQEQKSYQLRTIRVGNYAHNSYMIGPYGPKFLDSEHGRDFLQEHLEDIVSAQVRFAGPKGKVTVTLNPKACFSYSCNEDDQAFVQGIIRKLV